MLDNQLVAQLLINHRLATEEQIRALWPWITPERDVGMLLVERGVLPRQTYFEMAAYLGNLSQSAGPPAEEPSPAPAGDGSAAGAGGGGESFDLAAALDSDAMPAYPEDMPGEGDPGFAEFDLNSWSPAADEDGQPRKQTRAEYLENRGPDLSVSASIDAADTTGAATEPPAPPAPHDSHTPAIPAAGAAPGHAPHGTPAPQAPVRSSAATSKPAAAERIDGSGAPAVAVPASVDGGSSWEELLAFARHHDAADLHLSAGRPIMVRRYGALQAVSQNPVGQESVRGWVEAALPPEAFREFDAKGDLEFIYTLPHHGRYRVALIKQRRGWDVTARVVPGSIRSMEDAGLPESCRELTKWAQGLVLVTGPVGCGKTSTLATLVDIVNRERRDHIITIEEPIEILYPPASCRITQREIGPHTLSRDAALRAALREDPDIIVISELRDLETIRLAVSAAETGHLVFGTMNTANAARTLGRLIDSFPPEEQGIVRNMISESLRGVISQQLLPRKDGQGMLPAFEVLMVNSAVANMIRKDEIHQLGTAMLTGKNSGMVLLDDSLRFLVERGLVDAREAMARAANPKDFERYLGRR